MFLSSNRGLCDGQSGEALPSVSCLSAIEEPHRAGPDRLQLSRHEKRTTKFPAADLYCAICKADILFRMTLFGICTDGPCFEVKLEDISCRRHDLCHPHVLV